MWHNNLHHHLHQARRNLQNATFPQGPGKVEALPGEDWGLLCLPGRTTRQTWSSLTFDEHVYSIGGPMKEAQTMNNQLPVPFRSQEGPPLPGLCGVYLGPADLWNEVIEEVESLWYNYLCILGPLFSCRMAGDPLGFLHGSHSCCKVGREARCRLSVFFPDWLTGRSARFRLPRKEVTEQKKREEKMSSVVCILKHIHLSALQTSLWQNLMCFFFSGSIHLRWQLA